MEKLLKEIYKIRGIINEDLNESNSDDYIKKIKLESSFYNVFRNTIRILLNNYENIKVREKIEGEMLKEYIIYSDKLLNVNKLLRELVGDKIQFIGDENYYKKFLIDINDDGKPSPIDVVDNVGTVKFV